MATSARDPLGEPDCAAEEDWQTYVRNSVATLALAKMGLALTLDKLKPVYEHANESNNLWIGNGHPGEVGSNRLGWVPSLQLPTLLAPDGPVERRLNEQWLVNLYTMWDERYRKEIAVQRRVEKDQVIVSPLGDFRRIRHDIIHCQGVATDKNSGKCEVFQHWVEIGKPIAITTEYVYELVDALHLLLTVVDGGDQATWGPGRPLLS